VQAVEPEAAVRRQVRREGSVLHVGNQGYDLRQYERVFLVGAGKAGAPMARALGELVGDVLTSGVVVVKERDGGQETGAGGTAPAEGRAGTVAEELPLALLPARHPLPDERGVAATRRIGTLLEQASERDLVLVVLSGGGSALLTMPAPGIGLDDLQQLTTLLLACGARIEEINSLRKHLDLGKGGGLARLAFPAPVVSLILSDVVGDPLDVIASGPTVPDPTTFADAFQVLERYQLLDQTPPAIVERLRAGMRGEAEETPGEGDPLFARVRHVLVGSNRQAAAAALATAHAEGLHALILTTRLQGEARVVGHVLASVAHELATTGLPGGSGGPVLPRPSCLIVGGETTVTLRGDGRGGRNQEVALAAVRPLAGLANVALVTLATDGDDGPSGAAGAVVTGETLERARRLGLDPDAALARNDSTGFFAPMGDTIRIGSTQTNVNDLALVFAW
jgi:hydroxypyruvate reductase